jgi:magnesium-transporting ATPase (P-type)
MTSPDEDFDYNQFSINATFSFFLLSNSFIPLNMAVINLLTMYFYSSIVFADPQFIHNDPEHSAERGNIHSIKIKAMDLTQDLVLTNHIFCDKTGTLTRNLLIFRNLLIEGANFSAEESIESFTSQLKSHNF